MDFGTFARLHGLIIDDLYPSSRIRRCGTVEHPKSKSGAYLYEGDRGWVQDWSNGGEINWWDDERAEPTEAERAEWARRKAERERQQEQLWGKTAIRCRMMQDTTTLTDHAYMHRKGLADVLVPVLPDGEMFIPMRDVKCAALVGAQLIKWLPDEMKFEKKFVHGSRLHGSAMLIGPPTNTELVLCEGFATGHSIDKALRQMRLRATVVVCFNDSNMVTVSKLLHSGRRYVYADNDKSGAGEKAAKATGLNYCMSDVVGNDANDDHKQLGLYAVSAKIMEARQLEVPV
jgi:putative DNA primase/helicase